MLFLAHDKERLVISEVSSHSLAFAHHFHRVFSSNPPLTHHCLLSSSPSLSLEFLSSETYHLVVLGAAAAAVAVAVAVTVAVAVAVAVGVAVAVAVIVTVAAAVTVAVLVAVAEAVAVAVADAVAAAAAAAAVGGGGGDGDVVDGDVAVVVAEVDAISQNY